MADSIGAMRDRVTIQRPAAGQDEIGQPTTGWTALSQVWASVRYLSGLETIKGGAVSGVAKASVRIRWRQDVTTAMRVLHGSRVLQITAVLPDSFRRHVDLACEEVV